MAATLGEEVPQDSSLRCREGMTGQGQRKSGTMRWTCHSMSPCLPLKDASDCWSGQGWQPHVYLRKRIMYGHRYESVYSRRRGQKGKKFVSLQIPD